MAKRSVKIQGKGHLATKTNGSNGLNEVQKIQREKQRVRSDIFASSKSSSLDFFRPGFLFMTVSWRILFLIVLGNVTDSLLLCDVAGPLRVSILYWKLRFIPPFILWYSFQKLNLDDFSNLRANKRHFENFEQILLKVTLS